MSEKTPLVVGQKLWRVPTQKRHGEPSETEVTKIGRKWVYIGAEG